MKPAWQSLTIIVNLALFVLAWIKPDWAGRVCGNPELAIQVIALANLVMRFKTKKAVRMMKPKLNIVAPLLLLILAACGSVPQKLDDNKFYRRDLPFCVEGYGCFEGVTVLPKQSSYTFDVAPKGDANIDLMISTSCSREDSFEKTATG